jgi:hypothetical protein
LNGRGIGEADRGHIHHCLQDRGLSRAKSLIVISALCVAMAAVTLVSAYFQNDLLALGLCVALLALLIAGRVFGYNETVLFFRYIQALSALLASTSGVVRTNLFLARMSGEENEQPIHYWNEVTQHVAEMGGAHLEFVYWKESTEEVICRLRWSNDEAASENGPAWRFDYSVPGRDGLRATLTATGQTRHKLPRRRLIDLFRVFDTFCQSWSNSPLIAADTPTAMPAIPLSAGRGRLLPSSTPAEPVTPSSAPLERRAA